MNTNTQPTKGRWVYSYQFSKHFFIDEQGRVIDPDVANLTKPLIAQPAVQNAAAPVQRFVAPAPVQRPIAPAPVERPVAPAPVQRYVAPAPVQRYVAAPVPRPVAPAPVQRNVVVTNWAGPAPIQRHVAAPVPRPVAPTPSLARTGRAYVNRRTRSASVSSSGSSRSNSSRRSNTSARRPKAKATHERFQKVWLNRQAVLRRGPSLTTRVKKNLDKDTQITVDTSVVVNIFYRDNLRKRIKVVSPIVGWVTVETEKGRLYRKCRTSLESNI
jgi:hypothetical protein